MGVEFRVRCIILVANCCLNILVLFPILAYFYWRFNVLSNDLQFLIIQKRYPNAIKLSCCFVFFILLFERNFVAFGNGEFVEVFGETFIHVTTRISRVIYIMLQGVIFCGLWRFWLIHYDLKIAHCLSQSKWKKYLNSQLTENNWFINNKQKYGSTTYVKKVVITMWLIFSVIRITLFQLFLFHPTLLSLAQSIDSVLYLIPIILVLIIGVKAPHIQDKFYLRKEMTYYCLIVIIAIAIYIIGIVINRIGIIDYYWIQAIFCVDASLSVFGLAMIQTAWITRQIKMDPAYRNQHTILSNMNEMNDMQKSNKEITMKSYLSEQQGFDKFVQHLQKEFCLEIILFLIETNQFKELVKKRQKLQFIHEETCEEYKTDIYGGIFGEVMVPKSQIVYQIFKDEQPNMEPTKSFRNKILSIDGLPEFVMTHSNNRSTINLDEMSKLKTACFLLYDRYIRIGAELELNISYHVRYSLIQLLSNPTQFIEKNHDVNKDKLFALFDDAIKEQMSLMMYSFTRFKVELKFS
eukprot:49677_1